MIENNKEFLVFGRKFSYIQQDSESAHIGERTIEVPIAKRWLDFYGKQIIEVGAVMPYWLKPKEMLHQVVDPYDPYDKGIKTDAEELSFLKLNVLSISTIEHIGLTEYGNSNSDQEKANRVLSKIIEEANNYLITIPLGYNLSLDQYTETLHPTVKKFILIQTREDNRWEMGTVSINHKYNSPYKYANGVLFLTNTLEWIL